MEYAYIGVVLGVNVGIYIYMAYMERLGHVPTSCWCEPDSQATQLPAGTYAIQEEPPLNEPSDPVRSPLVLVRSQRGRSLRSFRSSSLPAPGWPS